MNEKTRAHFYISVFAASLGTGMITYFIPVFAQTFGATYLDLGIIGTVWGSATAITPVFGGYLADKINRARLFSLSLIVNAVAAFILVFSHSVIQIVVFRLLGGFGMGFYWAISEVLATDLAPMNKRVKGFGLVLEFCFLIDFHGRLLDFQ